MPSTRLIASETRILHPGQPEALTTEFVPPANPMTMSATVFLIKGGPMYFHAVEDEYPTSNTTPVDEGDTLDIIGSEDLRLIRLMATSTTHLEISYFGGGDQV